MIAVNPDDGRIALLDPRGDRACVVVGDRKHPSGLTVEGLTFLPEGRVAFATCLPSGKWHVCVGDRRSAEFDRVVPPIVPSPDGKEIGFYAVSGRDVWWRVMGVP
jgi:hypothetical protein